MSHITFLIGNGFDKHIGLETGYDQFLNWYIQQSSGRNAKISKFKQDLENNPHSEWWSDAELAMGKYANNYSADTLPDFFEIIEDFKHSLVKYLHSQENRCDFSNTQAIGDSFSHFLLNFQQDILLPGKIENQFSRKHGIEFNFLTFNYTKTLASIVEITKNTRPDGFLFKIPHLPPHLFISGTIEHIFAVHGNLNSSLIMGVNDESQIDFPSHDIPSSLRRILVKPQTIKAVGLKETEVACDILDRSDTIAIFGLRLGDSDSIWKERLWNWLQQPFHCVVLFQHDDSPNIHSPIIDSTLRYVDEKQTAFLKKLEPRIDQDGIEIYRDKIFVIPRTTQLNLNLIHE